MNNDAVQKFYNIVTRYIDIPNNRGDFYTVCPHCGKKKLNINLQKATFRCPYCDAQGGYLKINALFNGYYPNDMSNEQLVDLIKSSNIDYDKDQFKGKKFKVVEPKPIDYAKMNRAYRILWRVLGLNQKDIDNLRKRGLEDLGRYKSFEKNIMFPKEKYDPQIFKDVPGFVIDEKTGNARTASYFKDCILFPCVDINGNVVCYQMRNNNEEIAKRVKYVYFSSKKYGGEQTVSSYSLIGKITPNEPVLITEGPLKADCARQISKKLGRKVNTFVALPGVNSTNTFYKDLDEFKKRGVKKFILAFDMDRKTNEHVNRAFENLYNELISRGFEVSAISWDDNYKGIDDYLYSLLNK